VVIYFAFVSATDDKEASSSYNSLCFMFIALLFGAFITYILSRLKSDLPYTVVVFLFGILVSFCIQFVSDSDTLKRSIDMWDHIDPHLILYVFLPALLFGEAMRLNPHQFKSALSSVLVLAFPGAIFSASFIALAARFVLPYDWAWSLCMILGAILCTTDAVGGSNALCYSYN
jgi:NhaP-type Na+/H+ or K+/H+ antiporter